MHIEKGKTASEYTYMPYEKLFQYYRCVCTKCKSGFFRNKPKILSIDVYYPYCEECGSKSIIEFYGNECRHCNTHFPEHNMKYCRNCGSSDMKLGKIKYIDL